MNIGQVLIHQGMLSLSPAEGSGSKHHQNYFAGMDHSENLWLTLFQSKQEKKRC